MKRGHVYPSGEDWVVSNVQRTEDWSLDLFSNWGEYDVTGDETISQDRTHDVLNQLTDIDQTSLTYDLQGNLTDDGTQTYIWDLAGKLKEVKDDQDATIATMAYDPYGRRVTKDDQTNIYHYYYNGWQVLEEYVDDGQSTDLMARNVWGLYLDELVVRTDISAGEDLYPVTNPQHSPLRYYDGSGTLTARIQYTPYGKASLVDSGGSPITATEADYPILCTGQRHDVESGLDYFKGRMWSGELGRFVSRDPMGFPDGMNLYVGYFVPGGMDALGLMFCCLEWKHVYELDYGSMGDCLSDKLSKITNWPAEGIALMVTMTLGAITPTAGGTGIGIGAITVSAPAMAAVGATGTYILSIAYLAIDLCMEEYCVQSQPGRVEYVVEWSLLGGWSCNKKEVCPPGSDMVESIADPR